MSVNILSLINVSQVRILIFTSIIGCTLFTSDIPPDFPVTSPTEYQWFLSILHGTNICVFMLSSSKTETTICAYLMMIIIHPMT